MTLTELIVATILVGIVMVGTVSVDYAIRRTRQSTSFSGINSLETSATLLHISRNIALAVGDQQNSGIFDLAGGGSDGFCIRQDILTTPGDYTDDEWKCYTRIAQRIHFCTKTAVQGPLACVGTDETVGFTVYDSGTGTDMFTYSITNNPATRDFYVDVTITSRTNPLAPSDPLKNPQYQVSTRIAPMGSSYSFQ
ncbi:MAG: hypothetical protein Q8Q08_11015 [Candidatus Omnitrophota bacterium]|nr:hypothetical protein [Candidatus Omnitrophota bacterium]